MTMNMNRRDAIKNLALGSAAVAGARWLAAPARADEPQTTMAPAPVEDVGAFLLPPLPYPYEALEPHIDAQTMTIHHDKHHQAYVDNLNKAVAGHADLEGKTVDELLRGLDKIPVDIRTAVRNNGGGHANHSLFWKCLSREGGGQPEGPLGDAINNMFASFDTMKQQLVTSAKGVFGSGWVWLCLASDRKLLIITTPNQDSPVTAGHVPLLGIDVWEHAYYLKYQNRRPEYLDAIFNVIDWQFIGARYVEEMDRS